MGVFGELADRGVDGALHSAVQPGVRGQKSAVDGQLSHTVPPVAGALGRPRCHVLALS
ncbi:hypothetical protein ABZ783_24670 [Micromonospora sp. NPDC047738]|uniref:hypothetical protein n=1 Tax=Micromonospora sp. NPDC047738 TaxID=3155741 RepID=UPI0033E2EA41